MRLTVLGCAGTFPGPASGCSSYLVEQDGFRLLLDVGPGAIGALQRCGGLLDVDAALVSHLHADHCLDLVPYAYARRYHPRHRPPPLPVYGPPRTAGRICASFDVPPPDRLESVYDWRVTTAGRTEIGPFTVDLARVNHPVECHGVRLSAAGRSLVYSADTGHSDNLVGLATDSDLFLCEASFLEGGDNPPGVHLTGRQAGQHATRAGAQRLLLTHLVPWGDEARTLAEASAAYDGEVALARPDTSYQV